MRSEDKYNDKAGIIFLLLLIGTVFIADFFIEINKSVNSGNNQKEIKHHYIMPRYLPEPASSHLSRGMILSYKYHENLYNPIEVNAKLEISVIFFLLISFQFSAKNFNFDPDRLIISFLYFISFIFKDFANTALPRPPPDQVV